MLSGIWSRVDASHLEGDQRRICNFSIPTEKVTEFVADRAREYALNAACSSPVHGPFAIHKAFAKA